MRTFLFIALIHFYCSQAFSAENIDFKFKRKSYEFSLNTKGDTSTINWKKSGFTVLKTVKLKACFKPAFQNEVLLLRKNLTASSSKKLGGEKAFFSWNGRQVDKSLLPREMDSLDKKFTHLFNIVKNGEGKCLK